MEKRVELLGYDVTLKALGIETQGLKKVIFDFLKSHSLM